MANGRIVSTDEFLGTKKPSKRVMSTDEFFGGSLAEGTAMQESGPVIDPEKVPSKAMELFPTKKKIP